jgi:hypothetical protein
VKNLKNSQQINYESDLVMLMPIENESHQVFSKSRPQRPARVSQSNFATKVDMTHRKR